MHWAWSISVRYPHGLKLSRLHLVNGCRQHPAGAIQTRWRDCSENRLRRLTGRDRENIGAMRVTPSNVAGTPARALGCGLGIPVLVEAKTVVFAQAHNTTN